MQASPAREPFRKVEKINLTFSSVVFTKKTEKTTGKTTEKTTEKTTGKTTEKTTGKTTEKTIKRVTRLKRTKPMSFLLCKKE